MQNQDNNIVFVMLLRTWKQGHSWFLQTFRLCLYCMFGDREWVKNLMCCLTHPALDVGCLQCNRVSLSSGYLQILPDLSVRDTNALPGKGLCLHNSKWDRKKFKAAFWPLYCSMPKSSPHIYKHSLNLKNDFYMCIYRYAYTHIIYC